VAKAPVRDCACHARLENEETWRLAMTTRSTALTAPKAADGEPALKYVQANGLRFAYLEQGSGPLVMFMHGFPDNAWSYRKQMQVFADAGYRAVSPFLRGYAPTEIPADGIFDPIALGKDLEALIAALSDDGQACVVGMDWGGTSTFQALATAPSAIKAAVVMNTAHPIAIFEQQEGSRIHSIHLPCLFLPDARR
jgi:pimeloyl-ACP methyl ester carboxylesterase